MSVLHIVNGRISVDGPEAIFGRLFDHVGYGAIRGLFRSLAFSCLVVQEASCERLVICGDIMEHRMM